MAAAAQFPSLDAQFSSWAQPKASQRTGKKAQAARAAGIQRELDSCLRDEAAARNKLCKLSETEIQPILKQCTVEGRSIRKGQWCRPLDVADIDCSVCFCPMEDDDAVIFGCSNLETTHYLDAACFQHALSTLSQDGDAVAYWAKRKALKCMMCEEPILEASVYASGDMACIQAYVTVTRQLTGAVERLEAQREAEKIAMADSADAKNVLVKRMLSEIDIVMTTAISCPHCQAPFFDFNGCLALTCAACGKEFCGVCCRSHAATTDGHQMVRSCTGKLTSAQQSAYGFHGTYFIGSDGWLKWKEKLKTEGLYEYLRTLRVEFVWEFFHLIQKKLADDQLLSEAEVGRLKGMVFSHKQAANLHLVRLPNTFWLVYSAKNSVRFMDAVQDVQLGSDELIRMGKAVVERIRKEHPNWEPVRKSVPGETFQSINYPPEFLPLIATVVEDWGQREGYWK